MSNYNILKTNIAAQIKQNGAKAITGQILQTHLLSMITSLGAGYQYMGVAALNTNPGTPDYKCFYIATAVGTYSNFGSPALTVAQGEVAIFYYDTAWHKAVTGAASKADVDALIQTLEGEVSELGHYVDNKVIKGTSTDFLEVDEQGNMIDKTMCVQHYLVAGGTDGALKTFPNNDFWATDFIPLRSEEQYYFQGIDRGWFCFYDQNKNRISGLNTSSPTPGNYLPLPFITPAGTAYGRFSFSSSANKDSGWISKSQSPVGGYGYVSNGKLRTDVAPTQVEQVLYRIGADKLPVLTDEPLKYIRFDCGVVPMFRSWGVIGASRDSGEVVGFGVGSPYYTRVDDYQYSRLQQMCRLCGSDGYNFSVGGQTAKGWLQSTSGVRGFAYAAQAENLKQAYIIDIGGNDATHLENYSGGLGSVNDVDLNDYNNNADSFAGWYARIIQMMKEVNPYARFFCETQPYNPQTYNSINQVIREVVALFEYVYLMDMATYNPFSNYSQLQQLNDHGSPLGYLYNAYEEMNYIDWIVRSNFADFNDICFWNTNTRGFVNYSVSGTITNGASARVSLINDEHQFYAKADGDGGYSIIGIKPGTYTLTIAKDGYTTHTESIVVTSANITKNITL